MILFGADEPQQRPITTPMRVLPALACALVLSGAAAAQVQERRASHCIALAQDTPGLEYLHKADWQDPVAQDSVQIRYIAHDSIQPQMH